MKFTRFRPITTTVCLSGALVAIAPLAHAQADPAKMEKLEKDNAELRKRLDALESVAIKEGILPKDGGAKKSPLGTLTDNMTLSGFVSASYFNDFSRPAGGVSKGYLWSRDHNSFTLNKFKITLDKPVENNGENWSAGYRASLIFGQDGEFVNTGSAITSLEAVREAYVRLNVPVGTGLDVRFGQLISLLNYESGDGGAVNANFSQGNQWYFTGNGPSTGVQLGYNFNEVYGAKARVQNGLFTGVKDNNDNKTFMGSFDIKPDSKTSVSLIGFLGAEGAGNNHSTLYGGSIIGSRKLTDKYNLTLATEFDWFHLDLNPGSTDWWSIGGWLSADFTPVLGAALRVDYIKDNDGYGTGGLLGFAKTPFQTPPGNNTGQDLSSFTLTLNWSPAKNIKIQPEIRYDHTSAGLFDGQNGTHHRVIAGVGVSYLF